MDNDKFRHFKKIFEREVVKTMRDFKVPGMSFLITIDGKAFYSRAFGLRDREKTEPATIDTLYGVSSITKSFTSLAIMKLYEEGKLDINDEVSHYIDFTLKYKDKPILIKHLMSHSSGIPSLQTFYLSQMNQQLYSGKIPIIPLGNWSDFYFHVNDAQSEVLSPPETKYYYWNGGFTLLSQIVKEVSGLLFEEYVRKEILDPLEMKRSTFSKKSHDPDVAAGYNYEVKNSDFTRESRELLSGPYIAGPGGLISSVKELTNYLQCYLNEGTFNGQKVMSKETIAEMTKIHNPHIKSLTYDYTKDSQVGYGYGWRILKNYYGTTLITHQGVSGVTGGNVAIIPEYKITFAQLYNVSWLPKLLMHTALVLLMEKDPYETIPYYKRKEHYKLLCGKYFSYKKMLKLEIVKKGAMLYLIDKNWADDQILPLIPINETDPEPMEFKIFTQNGSLIIPFTKHPDGNITFDYERYILHKVSFEREIE